MVRGGDEKGQVIERPESLFGDEAYRLVLAAVADAQKGNRGHIKGPAVVESLVTVCRANFGLLAAQTLKHAGLVGPREVGACVYEMISMEIMSATEDDKIEDFDVDFDLLGKAATHAWAKEEVLREQVKRWL